MPIDPILPGRDSLALDKMNAAIAAANHVPLMVTQIGILADGKAPLSYVNDTFLTLFKDRDDLIRPENRPGDAPRLFTLSAGGETSGMVPLPAAAPRVTSDGKIYPLYGAQILASREYVSIEPDRVYAVYGSVRRVTNAVDPSGDTVRVGVMWFDAAKVFVSASVVYDWNNLVVADGRVSALKKVARAAGAGVDIVAPAGAVYMIRYIETFGGAQRTDVILVGIDDVTAQLPFDPDLTSLTGRVTALESNNVAARVDDIEAAIGSPKTLTFTSLTAAAAATIPVGVDIIRTLGYGEPESGGGAIYISGEAGAPGGVSSNSGTRHWVLSPDQEFTPEMFGASGFVSDDEPGDDTGPILAMLAALPFAAEVRLNRSYNVTAYQNFKATKFLGRGEIVTHAEAGSPALLAGPARLNFGKDRDRDVIGEEYLYPLRQRLAGRALNTPTRKNIVGYAYGDSTWSNPSTVISDFRSYPEYAMQGIAVEIGLPGTFSITNVAKGGTNLEGCFEGDTKDGSDPISNLATGVDLSMFKFGLNEAQLALPETRPNSLYTAAEHYLSVYRAKFAAIRADPNGTLDTHAIMFFGPNAAQNTGYQDLRWLEVFIPLIKQVCREYQVMYIDTCYRWNDAYVSGYRWTDGRYTAPGNGIPAYGPLHPFDNGWAMIWQAVKGYLATMLPVIGGTLNSFQNPAMAMAALPYAAPPSAFNKGLSQFRVTSAEGWIDPITGSAAAGLVVTHKSGDGDLASQTFYVDGTNRQCARRQVSGGDTWTAMTASMQAITLANGWVQDASGSPVGFRFGVDGKIHLQGAIRSGTVTSGTDFAVLPAEARPATERRLAGLSLSSGGSACIGIRPNGTMYFIGTASASWSCLDGISFFP